MKTDIADKVLWDSSYDTRQEAADEIERLREALRTIGYGPPNEGEPLELLNQFVDLARSALQQKETVDD